MSVGTEKESQMLRFTVSLAGRPFCSPSFSLSLNQTHPSIAALVSQSVLGEPGPE